MDEIVWQLEAAAAHLDDALEARLGSWGIGGKAELWVREVSVATHNVQRHDNHAVLAHLGLLAHVGRVEEIEVEELCRDGGSEYPRVAALFVVALGLQGGRELRVCERGEGNRVVLLDVSVAVEVDERGKEVILEC